MNDVMIDGVRYVRADEAGPIKMVVLDRGFVYVGRYKRTDEEVEISDARCVIRWGTKNHLGELINGPLDNTTLGDACVVRTHIDRVNHVIEVSQDGWDNTAD